MALDGHYLTLVTLHVVRQTIVASEQGRTHCEIGLYHVRVVQLVGVFSASASLVVLICIRG